jgi:hypothetical protein
MLWNVVFRSYLRNRVDGRMKKAIVKDLYREDAIEGFCEKFPDRVIVKVKALGKTGKFIFCEPERKYEITHKKRERKNNGII